MNNVVNFPPVNDLSHIKPVEERPREIAAVDPSGETENKSDNHLQQGSHKSPAYDYSALRLTVEKDERTGDWVYKAIDRVTGQVIRQLPRQELLNMKHASDYEAGSVIKTDI